MVGHSQKITNTRAATTAKLNVACPKTLSKKHAVGARDLCAPQHQTEKQTTRQHWVDATRKRWPPKPKYVTRYATLPNVERVPWHATHEGKTPQPPRCHKQESTPAAARTSPAGIGRGRHETRKVCESNKGTRAPVHKVQSEKNTKGTPHQKTNAGVMSPRAPSGQEVCPCTHVMQIAVSTTRYSPRGSMPEGTQANHHTPTCLPPNN